MVATFRFADFAQENPSKLAAPTHNGVVKQSRLLQVSIWYRTPLVDVPDFIGEMLLKVLGHAVKVVPIRIVKRDEANSSFNEPSRQKAVTCEAGLLQITDTIHAECRAVCR